MTTQSLKQRAAVKVNKSHHVKNAESTLSDTQFLHSHSAELC